MIINETDAQAQHILLVNHEGKPYTKCRSYNTVTKEAEFYATLNVSGDTGIHLAQRWSDPKTDQSILTNSLELVTFKCHLIGAKIIDSRTGKEYVIVEDRVHPDDKIGQVYPDGCTCQTIGGATCSACNQLVGEQRG